MNFNIGEIQKLSSGEFDYVTYDKEKHKNFVKEIVLEEEALDIEFNKAIVYDLVNYTISSNYRKFFPTLVVEKNNIPIGIISIMLGAKEAELHSIISKKHRNNDYKKLIILDICEFLKQKGMEKIIFLVKENNIANIKSLEGINAVKTDEFYTAKTKEKYIEYAIYPDNIMRIDHKNLKKIVSDKDLEKLSNTNEFKYVTYNEEKHKNMFKEIGKEKIRWFNEVSLDAINYEYNRELYPNFATLIIERNDFPLGIISFVMEYRTAVISTIIRPSMRGKSLKKFIIEDIKNYFYNKGIDKLLFVVEKNNYNNKKALEKLDALKLEKKEALNEFEDDAYKKAFNNLNSDLYVVPTRKRVKKIVK